MRKLIIKFGLVAGTIIILSTFLEGTLIERDIVPLGWTEIIGYASMLIALSMVFFGIKSYRDNHLGGIITYWKGFQIGFFISLIASVMYFGGGELYNAVNPNFFPKIMERTTQEQSDSMRSKGASQNEIDQKTEEMEKFVVMFKNPLIRFAVFVMEMLPVGLIMTLISAGLLRRHEPRIN